MRSILRFAIAASFLISLAWMNGSLHLLPDVEQKIHNLGYHLGTSTELVTNNDTPEVPATTHGQDHISSSISSTSHPTYDVNEKVVVMGRVKGEDTSWVQQIPEYGLPCVRRTFKFSVDLCDSWQNAVYDVDNHTASLHTTINKGREANVYLTYILENYNHLPLTIAFVHSHEKGYPLAWHTDAAEYSNVKSLKSLNIDFVRRNGYANLRCLAVPGCPDEVQPFREPFEEHRTVEHAFAEAWNHLFENDDVPHVLGTACCAQFAVSREQVLKRTFEFYARAYRWLQETSLDDATSGRIFEYIWHVIFGQEPVYCPDLQQCYKDVYGRH